ncbi:MAG: ABC transporter permease, partial [Devosia sp.]
MDATTSGLPVRRKPSIASAIGNMTWFSGILWALMLLVGLLVVYPLLTALIHEFDQVVIGLGDLGRGDLASSVPTVLWNTFVVVVGGTAIALVIGSALAWANERSDASLGWIGQLLPLAALIVPPIAGVIGWAVLLDPRAGLMNHFIRNMLAPLGISFELGPFNIYTMAGLVIITGLYIVPYVYLVVSAALQRLDPAVEEASRVSGANPFKTLYRVTLPAVRPSLVASALLGVISGVSLFSVPAILGGGARIDVLSVFIYRLLSVYPTRIGPALVLAMGMLILVQVLLVAQHLLIRRGQSAAIGGRGFRGTRVKLGPFRYLVLAMAALYLLATAVLPLLGLLLVSLQPFWTPSINWARL